MMKLLPAVAVASLALAAVPLAQEAGAPAADALPAGPIVGGKRIQPTQQEVVERLMQQRQDGQLPADDVSDVPPREDKELDEIYEQLMKLSRPGGSP